jgi:hypothetical protein
MRSANNVDNAGPHVRQTFLNDVFTFLSEVLEDVISYLFLINIIGNCHENKYI